MNLTAYLEAVVKPGQQVNRLFAFLGVRVASLGQGQACLNLPLRPEFSQGAQALAGGILATLLDEAMAHAVLCQLAPNQATATIELSSRFFKPVPLAAFAGATLRCQAHVVRQGRRIAFAEAEVLGPDHAVLAKAAASFILTGGA